MATAEALAKTSEKVTKKKEGLPALTSPGVRVPEALRLVIAKRCAESGTSFSVQTIMLWETLLKTEGRIPKDMKVEYKSSGGFAKALQVKDSEIEALKTRIAQLENTKK